MNKEDKSSELTRIKEYARKENVPIMQDEGIEFLTSFIEKKGAKSILEVGTAIGYSAIMMCGVAEDIKVTTIERDEKRYLEAIKNIKKTGLEDRIHLIYNDALNIKLTEKYDLIFIDAAKAQNRKFFERFENNLVENGTIITDNMKFHGLVDTEVEASISRNLRQLVRKIREYKVFLQENDKYETEFLDIGDGMAVSVKK